MSVISHIAHDVQRTLLESPNIRNMSEPSWPFPEIRGTTESYTWDMVVGENLDISGKMINIKYIF